LRIHKNRGGTERSHPDRCNVCYGRFRECLPRNAKRLGGPLPGIPSAKDAAGSSLASYARAPGDRSVDAYDSCSSPADADIDP